MRSCLRQQSQKSVGTNSIISHASGVDEDGDSGNFSLYEFSKTFHDGVDSAVKEMESMAESLDDETLYTTVLASDQTEEPVCKFSKCFFRDNGATDFDDGGDQKSFLSLATSITSYPDIFDDDDFSMWREEDEFDLQSMVSALTMESEYGCDNLSKPSFKTPRSKKRQSLEISLPPLASRLEEEEDDSEDLSGELDEPVIPCFTSTVRYKGATNTAKSNSAVTCDNEASSHGETFSNCYYGSYRLISEEEREAIIKLFKEADGLKNSYTTTRHSLWKRMMVMFAAKLKVRTKMTDSDNVGNDEDDTGAEEDSLPADQWRVQDNEHSLVYPFKKTSKSSATVIGDEAEC